MSKLAKLTIAIILNLVGFSTLIPAQMAFSADDTICNNPHVANDIKAGLGCPGTSVEEPEHAVGRIVSTIVAILGLVAIIVIIYGGVQYMTSAGDASKIKKAKDTILYAAIGLIICVLAFAITQFVIGSITGSSTM